MKTYNPESYITVIEISKAEIEKIDFALCKQPRQTLKDFYDDCSTKPDIICNGGFFNMSDGTTVFNFKDENKVISNNPQYKWGIGITSGELVFGCVDNTQFTDFVSAYPPLVEDSKAISITYAKELDYKARRTMLGYNKDTVFIVAVELPGMTFKEMQKLMLELGCTFAINLDGGGSTKILDKDGKSITSTVYNRAVDNVVAVYLKKIYRVQAGAFMLKSGSEKLLKQIKALDDKIGAGYKNAYIRKIGGFYKVQIGAFSKKSGAEKVKADLISKGINCFITCE